jgi:hypothetical protein
LVHKIAHAHGLGYAEFGRERCEVLVDCVTYCLLGYVGLDAGGESIPCVAGWGEHGALDAIRRYAATIDTVAGASRTHARPRVIRWSRLPRDRPDLKHGGLQLAHLDPDGDDR